MSECAPTYNTMRLTRGGRRQDFNLAGRSRGRRRVQPLVRRRA